MADLKISEMVAASQSEMTDGTLIETSIEDESSSTGYSTRKGLLSQVANYVLNAFRGLSLGGAVRSVKEAIDQNSTDIGGISDELSAMKTATVLNATDDLNDIKINGWYYVAAASTNPANVPDPSGGYYFIRVVKFENSNVAHQYAVRPYGWVGLAPIYVREYTGNPAVWSAWRAISASVVPQGDITFSGCMFANGHLTNASKSIRFFIPYNFVRGTASLVNLSLVVRGGGAQYPYIRSGSGGSTYSVMGSDILKIYENGQAVRSNEVESVSITPKANYGFQVIVNFVYPVCKTNTGTTADNNVPLSIMGDIRISLS